jgi:NAD+ diphosphatase
MSCILPFIFSENQWLVPVGVDLSLGISVLEEIELRHFEEYEQQRVKIATTEYGEHCIIDMQQEQYYNDAYQLLSLREALGILPEDEFGYLAQAWQYAIFLREHKYCAVVKACEK